jgi:hypothetical protein
MKTTVRGVFRAHLTVETVPVMPYIHSEVSGGCDSNG